MGNSAFKDRDYIKKRYDTANGVFGFMQGGSVFALLLFALLFTGRFYWLHNFKEATKSRRIRKVEIVEININHGFDDIESFLYTVASLAEIKVKFISDKNQKQSIGNIFIHYGTIKRAGLSVGDSLDAYALPSNPFTLFPAEYSNSVPRMFKSDLRLMIFTTALFVLSVFVFRWKRKSLTKNIASDDYEEIVGECISKSAMDRAVRFKYEISGKIKKQQDIVTKKEFEQISVGERLVLFVMRESPKRPFIKPIVPVLTGDEIGS